MQRHSADSSHLYTSYIQASQLHLSALSAKMVYDWENKEELCYRLYIEEKKSLEEIMEFLKEHHKFTPR